MFQFVKTNGSPTYAFVNQKMVMGLNLFGKMKNLMDLFVKIKKIMLDFSICSIIMNDSFDRQNDGDMLQAMGMISPALPANGANLYLLIRCAARYQGAAMSFRSTL